MHLPSIVAVLGWPEDGLTKTQAEYLSIGGAIICAIAIVFVIRQMRKVATRVVAVALLLAIGGFFVWQHQELQDCAGQCSCRLLGRDLAIRDENAFCPN